MPRAKSTPKRRKLTTTQRSVSFCIPETSPADLAKFASQTGGAFGRKGTIGRELEYGEFEGNELPELEPGHKLWMEKRIDLRVRVTCDQEGSVFLDLIRDGSKTYHSFRFKGCSPRGAYDGLLTFAATLDRSFLANAVYTLFWAHYRKTDTKANAEEALEKIVANCENFFTNVLRPKRMKEIKSENFGGITLTTYEPINSNITEQDLWAEREECLKQLAEAIKAVRNKGRKPTQYEVGGILWPKADNIPALINNYRKKFNLPSWKILSTALENTD